MEVSNPPYTVDLCCLAPKLIIEVDGDSHDTHEGQEYGRVRDAFLDRQSFKMLRIREYAVTQESE